MYQDQEKIYTIRTLGCDICDRYDSLMLTQSELENKVNSNSLHIGSKILSHGNHLRIVYFDEDGNYLGDTMSLNISDVRITNTTGANVPFLLEEDRPHKNIHRRMLQVFSKTAHTMAIIGPSMAGKTSLALFLESGIPERITQRINHPATMGKSVKRFDLAHNSLTIFDLGGQRDFWSLWGDQIKQSGKIIFVVDGTANNRDEISDALDLLWEHIKSNQELLIVFNKLDLYLEGYSQKFSNIQNLLHEENIPDNLQYWVIEASIYNGIVYNYSDTQEETSLATAILDFLDR